MERAIRLVDDRLLNGTSADLIYDLERFRDDDLPPREEQKRHLADAYQKLERSLRNTDFFRIHKDLSTQELHRLWNELLNSIERRFHVLEEKRNTEVLKRIIFLWKKQKANTNFL